MLAVSTLRIYYTEPARLAFDATVVAVEPADRSAQVVLDRTAFYPTSGGQPFDTGTLGTAQVVDVVDDEATGRILHVVEGLPPAVGDSVAGTVDGARRADHTVSYTHLTLPTNREV